MRLPRPSSGKAPRRAPSTPESAHEVLEKWWQALHRSIVVQLVLSMLMQVSYVAFPAYNFAMALWCLLCCTPKWFTKNPRLTLLVLGAVAFSVLTDIIWISLWVSGRVFYDQFCGKNGVSIVSCGGASDYYPGCTTNRFALFAMLSNNVAKIVTAVCVHRIQKLQSGGSKKNAVDPPTATAVPARRRSEIQQLPPSSSVASLPPQQSMRKLPNEATAAQGEDEFDPEAPTGDSPS